MGRAREAGMDLVEVDANGNPPVCRVLDYGKWKYEQAKKERDARKHQRGTMIHEVRMRPRTGQHDIDLKVKIAERLLGGGDKVKLSVMFRGREMSHPEIGHEVLGKALSKLTEAAGVEKPPGMEGRFLTVILTPAVKKPVTAAKPGEDGDGAELAAVGNGQVATAPKAAATPKPTAARAETATPKPTAAKAEAATPKPTAAKAEAAEATPAAAPAQEAEKTSG
jgi:translation initiation factor IF-3